MAGFVMRKNQRFKESVPVRYRGHGLAGEGIVKDISLSGCHIKGTTPVVEGMVFELHIDLPGEQEPLRIEQAPVQWVKGLEFGVELKPQREVAERVTKLIADLVRKRHGSSLQ